MAPNRNPGPEMLSFNIPNKPRFASDPETREVFGISSTPEQGSYKGVYVVGGERYLLPMELEGDRANPRLKFQCASIAFGLRGILQRNRAENSALIRRTTSAIAGIQRTNPIVDQAILCSDFGEFEARARATGRSVPFDMPTDRELREMSIIAKQ